MGTPFHGGGNGFVLEISIDGGSVYEDIAGIQELRFLINREEIDVTDHDSAGWKEFIAGNGDLAIECTCNFEPDDAGQEDVIDNIETDDGTIRHFRLRPKGSNNSGEDEWIVQGFITGAPIGIPTGAQANFNFSIRVTGAPTRQTQS